MAQSSKYYNASNTKKAEEMYNLNVEDLMNEEDDDDNLDDVDISDDDDLEKFIASTGISKQGTGSSYAQNKSSQQSEEGKQYLASAASQLASIQPSTFNKNYLDNLSSDSDDENDKELYEQLIAHQSKTKKGQDSTLSNEFSSLLYEKQGSEEISNRTLKLQRDLSKMDILDLVEKNEKMNEVVAPEKLNEQGSQLLSFDKKFYNVQKKLMFYSEFSTVAKKLHFQKDHQFSGIVSAIAVYQNYLFVGNSSGIIRVFDLKTQKEMKPLMDSSIGANKVTSIEIADDGGFLISGYKKGIVALWDLIKYKLMRVVTDAHGSDVTNAKIYYINEVETIFAISSEDNGAVSQIEFGQKTFLGGYSYMSQFLFKSRLKGTSTIAVQRKNEIYPHKYCDASSLVSFGGLNEIVVCSMRPIKEIFQISKPSFCKEKSLPYIDWGYGLTPSKRDKTVPIMAFAWDRLIQLIYINESTQTIEMDGFYYSDQEINSLFFMGDGILFALVNGREVKVLHTAKFYPGHYKFLENARKDDMLNNQFEKVISLTANSELEKGHEISDIRSTILQCQSVMNYNQCVKKQKTNIYFMGSKSVLKGRLYSWKEYIDHIKFQESQDWLTVLKVALEIYNGDSKGYAKVPDEKEIRETQLKPFMKDMIKESVQQVIFKYTQGSTVPLEPVTKGKDSTQVSERYQADQIAIKVAIEFCLNINAIDYLFTDIYQIFVDNKLEDKFLSNLEPFILSGQFRNQKVPNALIRKLIKYQEDQKRYKVLEKIIMQLDLSTYSNKDELLVTCQHYCMVSALLYLMTSQQEEELGCMQILNTMFKLMREAKSKDYNKEDMYTLATVDSQKKYEIEKSKAYIGYKLLWIIKIFLEGKMFPYGNLSQEKWRIHVYDIAHFISNEEFFNELLQFDPDQFFKVVSKLFHGQPYKFLVSQDEYFTKLYAKGYEKCKPVKDIVIQFHRKTQNDEQMLQHYYSFILAIQAAHLEDGPADPKFNLEYQTVLDAIMNEVNKAQSIDEDTLIKAIKSKKLEMHDVDLILAQLDKQAQFLPHLRIYLVEKKKDFVRSFHLNLANSQLKKHIFGWIEEKLEDLQSRGDSIQPYQDLKKAIHDSIKDLISIDVNQAIQVVDKWYEGSYQDTLILDELGNFPEIQFTYLKNFLNKNEEKIKTTIHESHYQQEKQAEAQKYMKYLVKHTELLCKFARTEVQLYVKKDYYPVQDCLNICQEQKVDKGVAVLLKRNGQYLSAIQRYLDILKTLDQSHMLFEIKKLAGDQHTMVSSDKWDFQNLAKPSKNLQEFDAVLQKAINIAEKRQNEIQEEGWFTILDYLGQIVQDIVIRLDATQNRADKLQFDRLKDFVLRRKNAVLKKMPNNISMTVIIEKLDLEFKEIKQLYDFKIKAITNDEKYLKLAKSILVYELNELSTHLRMVSDKGWDLQTTEKCQACQVFLNKELATKTQRLAFKKFSCDHSFHINCLKENKCTLCVKQSIEIVSKSELRKKGKNDKEEVDEEDKGSQLNESGSMSPERGNQARSQGLFLKQLEVFDSVLEHASLNASSFY